jgi:hypothetical protein
LLLNAFLKAIIDIALPNFGPPVAHLEMQGVLPKRLVCKSPNGCDGILFAVFVAYQPPLAFKGGIEFPGCVAGNMGSLLIDCQ